MNRSTGGLRAGAEIVSQPSDIIQRFAAVARPFMLRYMGRQSCIAAARLCCEVLRPYGVSVEPIPCTFVVQVPALNLAYVSGLRGEALVDAKRKTGNWICRTDGVEKGWDGHMVVVANNRWLIDAAFDQATMDGFPLDPMVLVIDLGETSIPARDIAFDASMVNDENLEFKLSYWPLDDWSFQDSEAWMDEGLPWLAQEIRRAMGVQL